MTIAMLALAGMPATAGFFGKLQLIRAAVDNEYGWIGVAIVIGSAISLAYYLRVIAAVWMRSPTEAVALRPGGRPAIAGGSQEADAEVAVAPPPRPRRQLEVLFVAVVCATATIVFGIYPEPLFDVARDAGAALTSLGLSSDPLGGEVSCARSPISRHARSTPARRLPSTRRCSRSWRPRWRAPAWRSALGGVATAVADGVRTGICIVAGDVCRASDAAAAGLSPCTVAEHTRGEGLTFTVASLRLGADDGWTAARRSDGSMLITHAQTRKVGGSVGIGVEASPLGLEVGVGGKFDYVLGSGRAWEFPDAAAAVRFLRSEDRDDVEPTWRFGDAGAVLTGAADAGAGGLELTVLESTAAASAGRARRPRHDDATTSARGSTRSMPAHRCPA